MANKHVARPGVKRPLPKTVFLRCEVGRGDFDLERVITFHAGVRQYSSIVWKSAVRVAQEPTGPVSVPGWVQVTLLGKSRGQALIDLPRETFTSGPRVTVSLKELKFQ